ncbi:Rho-binding antiterminator [Marinobacter sp. MDS2]|uniref:Rho-binding antiterminator n=1 Tax=Marinobacter sp. MDS2 TaxID=3065961 RepID=UPI00353048B5
MVRAMMTCDQQDYIEIACMYRYPIKLVMKSGAVVEGVGLDTAYDEHREECIKVDSKGVVRLIPLDLISSLEVCVDNPNFQRVSFT